MHLPTLTILFGLLNLGTSSNTPIPTHQPQNYTLPVRNSCTFYKSSVESQYHCGPSGYPLQYGYKFCEKFEENRSELSPAARKWMGDVLLCLQEKLVPFVDGSMSKNVTCDELEKYAFSTHPYCYVDSGFCKLSVKDWEAVVQIVGLETLVKSWDIFKATVEVADDCADFYFWALKRLF